MVEEGSADREKGTGGMWFLLASCLLCDLQ